MSDWVFIPLAVQMMAERLALTVGGAGAGLCDACASGTVRWREWPPDDGFITPIRTAPGGLSSPLRLTKEAWRQAHIDRDAVVTDRGIFELVRVSREDLEFWLSQRGSKGSRGSPSRPAATRGRTPNSYWEEAKREAFKWLDENGSPREGTGEQAQLEAHIAGHLAAQGHHPSESRVRDYVVAWVKEFRAGGRG